MVGLCGMDKSHSDIYENTTLDIPAKKARSKIIHEEYKPTQREYYLG